MVTGVQTCALPICLYVTRGYNFDGSGVWWNDKPLGEYEPCENDDDLNLWMSKKLK